MMELADMRDLGSRASRRWGSSPHARTTLPRTLPRSRLFIISLDLSPRRLPNMDTLHQLMNFISRSPSPYHAVGSAAALLEEAGFTRLEECASWTLEWGKGYYTTR